MKKNVRDVLDDELEMEEDAGQLLPEVDINLPAHKRPLTGYDIQSFQAKFNMQRADVIYALTITNPIMLAKLMETRHPLDFAVELLLRLYAKRPGPAPWRSYTPSEGLTMIFGDVIALFEGTDHYEEAVKFCQRRLVTCFGRHSTAAYRWFDMDGRSKQVLSRVMAKLSEEGEANDYKAKRDLLEGIVRQIYRLRGESALDEPLPTADKPPVPRRRGPVPGSKRKPRVRETVAAAAPAEAPVRNRAQSRREAPVDLSAKLAEFMKEHGTTESELSELIAADKKVEKVARTAPGKVTSKRASSARK